ncbi:DUF5719 family protein [Sinomonas sp. ASV486]|uniref:DUF5719 family protein n=1 Tax=Sinomonas sp. ASV486 TaxID=3051170 RepID=UPI0027DBBB13|nr:DUF5719 family protein [Sinomonas sp. ASV486]MDQ4490308.1 DUF5719 family protein [Sinomonas sp. ASV486]
MTKPASDSAAGTRRHRLRIIAAAVAGTALTGVWAGLTVVASTVPAPASLGTREAQSVRVPTGDAVRACAGPARLLEGSPVQGDPQFSPASKTAQTSVTGIVLSDTQGTLPDTSLTPQSGSALRTLPGQPAPPGTVAQPRAAVVAGQRVDGLSVLTAKPVSGSAAATGAAVRFEASDGDLRGLAAATCTAPSNDQWLSGGETTVGRTSVLTLANSSATPATVDLEFFGDKPLTQAPPSSRGLTIKPGSSASYVLSGYMPGQANVSVHVHSSGGPVAAAIQQSTLRGLTPGGVELITPAAAPSSRQTVSGIELQEPGQANALAAKDGFADARAAVQITVPGAADAVVQLRVYGRNGAVQLPSGGVVTAKAGAVTEVPLTGLPAGTYSVSASADVSFTASARVPRGLSANDPLDFAVAAATQRIGDNHVVAIGSGGSRQMVFGVPDGRAQIRAVPVTDDGAMHAPVTLDVAGGTTAVLDVPDKVDGAPLAGYVLSASGDAAFGSILLKGDGNAIAAATIVPAAAAAQTMPVTLGY